MLDPRDCWRVRVGWEVRCDEGEVVCADEEGGMLRVDEPCDVCVGRVGGACGRGRDCGRGWDRDCVRPPHDCVSS